MNKIDHEVPDDLDVHVILDNLSTHKTRPCTSGSYTWPVPLPLHPDHHGSWMNLVEHWFSHSPPEAATLRAPQRQRARRRHPNLGRHLEREPPTLHAVVGGVAVLAFGAGIALLISQLPRHRPPPDKNGAVL
ncbi:MAG: hypothetical protein U0R27_00350 [Candidatus Nanopelagicales bacterium]